MIQAHGSYESMGQPEVVPHQENKTHYKVVAHPEFGIDEKGNWPRSFQEKLWKYGLVYEFVANVALIDGGHPRPAEEVRSWAWKKPVNAEPSNAEPSNVNAEPVNAEPSNVNAEPVNAEPVNAEPSNVNAEPVNAEPSFDDLDVFAIVVATKLATIKDSEKASFYKQNLALLARSIKQMEGYSDKMVSAIVKYAQFKARKPSTIQDNEPVHADEPFRFSEDDAFAAMVAADRVKWETQIEAYKLNTRTGTAQDVLGINYGVTQKAVSNWVRAVKGEVARRRGEAYELHVERTQRASGRWKDVTRVSGESNSDIIRTCFDGTVEIVSVKCHDSVRPETSLITDESNPKCEITPELAESRARHARGERARLVLHFYNHSSKFMEERVLDPARLQPSECFTENRSG